MWQCAAGAGLLPTLLLVDLTTIQGALSTDEVKRTIYKSVEGEMIL